MPINITSNNFTVLINRALHPIDRRINHLLTSQHPALRAFDKIGNKVFGKPASNFPGLVADLTGVFDSARGAFGINASQIAFSKAIGNSDESNHPRTFADIASSPKISRTQILAAFREESNSVKEISAELYKLFKTERKRYEKILKILEGANAAILGNTKRPDLEPEPFTHKYENALEMIAVLFANDQYGSLLEMDAELDMKSKKSEAIINELSIAQPVMAELLDHEQSTNGPKKGEKEKHAKPDQPQSGIERSYPPAASISVAKARQKWTQEKLDKLIKLHREKCALIVGQAEKAAKDAREMAEGEIRLKESSIESLRQIMGSLLYDEDAVRLLVNNINALNEKLIDIKGRSERMLESFRKDKEQKLHNELGNFINTLINIINNNFDSEDERYMVQRTAHLLREFGLTDPEFKERIHSSLPAASAWHDRANEMPFWDKEFKMLYFKIACALDPDYYLAWNSLGALLLERSIYIVVAKVAHRYPHKTGSKEESALLEEAINCFNKAIKIKPDFADALSNLGRALIENGKDDEALVCIENALRLNPNLADALNNKGVLLLHRFHKDGDQLLEERNPAIQRGGDKWFAWYNKHGNTLLTKAEEILSLAINIDPNFAEAWFHKAVALLDLYIPIDELAKKEFDPSKDETKYSYLNWYDKIGSKQLDEIEKCLNSAHKLHYAQYLLIDNLALNLLYLRAPGEFIKERLRK